MKTDSDLEVHAQVGGLLFFPHSADCIAIVEMERSGFAVKLYAPGQTKFSFWTKPTREEAIRGAEVQMAAEAERKAQSAQRAVVRAEQASELLKRIFEARAVAAAPTTPGAP